MRTSSSRGRGNRKPSARTRSRACTISRDLGSSLQPAARECKCGSALAHAILTDRATVPEAFAEEVEFATRGIGAGINPEGKFAVADRMASAIVKTMLEKDECQPQDLLPLGFTQEEFAARYQIPIGTLRDWEQGRTEPDQPARAYLKVIAYDAAHVHRILRAADRSNGF